MKKLFAMLSIVCAFALMVSCSSSSPSSVVETYMSAVKSENYDKMVDLMYFSGSAESAKEAKEGYLSMIKQMNESNSNDKSDALASFKVVKETINEDGDKATVEVAIVTKDGKERTDNTNVVLVDGKWYVDSGK